MKPGILIDDREYLLVDNFARGPAAVHATSPVYNSAAVWNDPNGTLYLTATAGSLSRSGTGAIQVCQIALASRPTAIIGSGAIPADTRVIRISTRASLLAGNANGSDSNSLEVIFARSGSVLNVSAQTRLAGAATVLVDSLGSSAAAQLGTANPSAEFPFRIYDDGVNLTVKVPGGERVFPLTAAAIALDANTRINVCLNSADPILYTLRAY